MAPEGNGILEVENLSVSYDGPPTGWFGGARLQVHAVDGVSFSIAQGSSLGLVGESGCGKTSTGLAVLQLVRASGGRVLFEGRDVLGLRGRDLRLFRRQAQVVFQDPYSSLHPRKTVGAILEEPIRMHLDLSSQQRRHLVRELLSRVGLPETFVSRYPRNCSGGQRQRVAIARALALNPKLVVLDEPLSALDVSIRAQILKLLQDLQADLRLTYLFISHDLALVRRLCRTTAVMYLGKIVEYGATTDLFSKPAHPYTRALLSAIPIPDPEIESRRPRIQLPGEVPSSLYPPAGCRFHPRCSYAAERCTQVEPMLQTTRARSTAACHFWQTVQDKPFDLTPGTPSGRGTDYP